MSAPAITRPGGLGRVPKPDPRDLNYAPLRGARLGGPQALLRRFWRPGAVLNQGATSSCVGHAWWALLAAGPIMQAPADPSALQIYLRARMLDEWAGEDYDGTSVRGGAKVCQERGFIGAYTWQFTADELALALQQGPAVLGTYWYPEMDIPSPAGIVALRRNAAAIGGHAFLCYGYRPDPVIPDHGPDPFSLRGWFRCQNSWGTSWGQGGRFWMSWDDMDFLLAGPGQGGEACTPLEIRAGEAPSA